jgi:hypothetical protein
MRIHAKAAKKIPARKSIPNTTRSKTTYQILSRRTGAVTGPPPKKIDFKIDMIGGSGSPLGSSV